MPPAWTGAAPTTQANFNYRVDASLSRLSPAQDIRAILSSKKLAEEETWVNLNRLNSYGAISGSTSEPMTYSLKLQYAFQAATGKATL